MLKPKLSPKNLKPTCSLKLIEEATEFFFSRSKKNLNQNSGSLCNTILVKEQMGDENENSWAVKSKCLWPMNKGKIFVILIFSTERQRSVTHSS